MKLPAELKPEAITAIIDTREQLPLDLSPLCSIRDTLTTGVYSVRGLEHLVALERKSLGNLLAYPARALVIESTWPTFEAGNWHGEVTPSAALGSVLGWIAAGLPVVMAGDHSRAGQYVSRLLFTVARRRWRELRALAIDVGRRDEPPLPLTKETP